MKAEKHEEYSAGWLDLDDIQTEYVEPGTLATISGTRVCRVYETLPVKSPGGMRHRLHYETSGINVIHELHRDEEVIIRPIPQQTLAAPGTHSVIPDAYHATIFKRVSKKQEDMPETGDEIEILKEGYIVGNDIKHIKFVEEFQRFDEPIFERVPGSRDVRQTTLGNCYLLSSLIAMLNQDEGINFIRSIMRQLEHTTVVQLFNPITLEPMYVEVENSSYYKYGRAMELHQGKYLAILEKVIAGTGFAIEGDVIKKGNGSLLNIFGSGGQSTLIFTMLTGQESSKFKFYPRLPKINHETEAEQQFLPWLSSYVYFLSAIYHDYTSNKKSKEWLKGKIIEKLASDETIEVDTLFSAFNGYENFLRWVEFHFEIMQTKNIDLKNKYRQMKNIFLSLHKRSIDNGKPIILSDVLVLLSELEGLDLIPTSIIDAWRKFSTLPIMHEYTDSKEKTTQEECWNFRNEKQFGVYTKHDLDVYYMLEILQDNHYVTVSTLSHFPKKIPGLRNKHAYAFEKVETQIIDGIPTKYACVYNPWGNTGMVLGRDTFKEDRNLSHFKIELSVFCKHFYAANVCQRVEKVGLKKFNAITKKEPRKSRNVARPFFKIKTVGINNMEKHECIRRLKLLANNAQQLIIDFQRDEILSNKLKLISIYLQGLCSDLESNPKSYEATSRTIYDNIVFDLNLNHQLSLNLDRHGLEGLAKFEQSFQELYDDLFVPKDNLDIESPKQNPME